MSEWDKKNECIKGSALALHCSKAHAKINRKMGNSTPRKIVNHHLAVTFVSLLAVQFFSWSYIQVIPLGRFSRFMSKTTCFHARTVLLGVGTIDDVIWGKYAPKTPKKNVNKQFPAKSQKFLNLSLVCSRSSGVECKQTARWPCKILQYIYG